MPSPNQDRTQQLDWLKQQLSPRRYQHSLGVEETAIGLADKFQLTATQLEAVATAARLHDCAKCQTTNELLAYAETHELHLDDADEKCPQNLHAIVGSHLVQQQFGITNKSIINAIRWHTTGRAHMGLVEKLVYIADKIEPTLRDPNVAAKVLEVINPNRLESLDDAVLMIMGDTVRFLLSREQWIHPVTMEARNHFLQRVNRPPREYSASCQPASAL